MPYLKIFIIFIILFSSSCTSNIQKNGLSIAKINQIKGAGLQADFGPAERILPIITLDLPLR